MEENIYEMTSQVGPQSTPAGPRLFALQRRDMILAGLMCLISVAFSMFALWGGFRAGYSVVSLAMFAVITAYLYSRNTKLKAYPLLCGVLACILPSVFFVTSNGGVRFWSFLAINLLHCVWFASLVGRDTAPGDLGLIKSVFRWLTRGMFAKMPKSMASLFCAKSKRRAGMGKALIGIALALPVLMIVLPLLISSDAAFSGFAAKFTQSAGEKIFQVIVGLLITPFAISFCFALKKTEEPAARQSKFKGAENAIIVSFLSMLSVCYLAYLFSQLAYFFSAFSGFLPEGYSFQVSEYARRGFFEMTAIAAINFAIIFSALLLSRKKDGKMCLASRLLCLFISLFTLIIIATALSKMWLYIDSFGMTIRRITTSAFMIFLAVVFLSLILRLFIPKVRVLQIALLTASCILLLLGAFNVNRVVATYNYEAYKTGVLDSIDVWNIYDLGDEGVPYLVKLSEDADPQVSQDAQEILQMLIEGEYYHVTYGDTHNTVTGRRHTNLGAYSISRGEAYRVLDKYIKQTSTEFVFEQ